MSRHSMARILVQRMQVAGLFESSQRWMWNQPIRETSKDTFEVFVRISVVCAWQFGIVARRSYSIPNFTLSFRRKALLKGINPADF